MFVINVLEKKEKKTYSRNLFFYSFKIKARRFSFQIGIKRHSPEVVTQLFLSGPAIILLKKKLTNLGAQPYKASAREKYYF